MGAGGWGGVSCWHLSQFGRCVLVSAKVCCSLSWWTPVASGEGRQGEVTVPQTATDTAPGRRGGLSRDMCRPRTRLSSEHPANAGTRSPRLPLPWALLSPALLSHPHPSMSMPRGCSPSLFNAVAFLVSFFRNTVPLLTCLQSRHLPPTSPAVRSYTSRLHALTITSPTPHGQRPKLHRHLQPLEDCFVFSPCHRLRASEDMTARAVGLLTALWSSWGPSSIPRTAW